MLGETREAIAAEKLAVVSPGAVRRARRAGVGGRRRARPAPPGSRSSAARTSRSPSPPPRPSSAGRSTRATAEAVLGARAARAALATQPLEIWDGAHNLAGIGYLLPRLPTRSYTIVASILADKRRRGDAASADAARRDAGRDRVAESARLPGGASSPGSPRRTSRGSRRSPTRQPRSAARAQLAGPAGAVLVTGSLYLLAALSLDGVEPVPVSRGRGRPSVFIFAAVLLALYVGLAFAAGWLIGKVLPLTASIFSGRPQLLPLGDVDGASRLSRVGVVVLFWLATVVLGLEGRAPADRRARGSSRSRRWSGRCRRSSGR